MEIQMDNVFISTDYAGFTVPAQHAHLARSWQDVCHLEGKLFWIAYDPVFKGSRHYRVSVVVRAHSGIHHRSSTRYATLDNAVRAAIKMSKDA
jgi:hypothetical protein